MIHSHDPLLLEALMRLRHDNDFKLLMEHLDQTVQQAVDTVTQPTATSWNNGYLAGLLELPRALHSLDTRVQEVRQSRRTPANGSAPANTL